MSQKLQTEINECKHNWPFPQKMQSYVHHYYLTYLVVEFESAKRNVLLHLYIYYRLLLILNYIKSSTVPQWKYSGFILTEFLEKIQR